MLDYIQQQLNSNDPDTKDFAKAQQWTVLAFAQPSKAVRELATALIKAVEQNDKAEQVRMVSLMETLGGLAEPLAALEGFTPLLTYARGVGYLARGDVERANVQFNAVQTSDQLEQTLGIHLPIIGQIQKEHGNIVQQAQDSRKDFLISYHSADHDWAEWIAWQLEDFGYSFVLISEDDTRRKVLPEAEHITALISPDYRNTLYHHPYGSDDQLTTAWNAAFEQRLIGLGYPLLRIQVRAYGNRESIILPGSFHEINLVGLDEKAAREKLLMEVLHGYIRSSPYGGMHQSPERPRFPDTRLPTTPALTVEEVREALNHLDDTDFLETCGLSKMHYILRRTGNGMTPSPPKKGTLVQDFLRAAFERMRPGGLRSDSALEWRLYNILWYRYFKYRLANAQTAARLGLSTRQFYRELDKAIQSLLKELLDIETEAMNEKVQSRAKQGRAVVLTALPVEYLAVRAYLHDVREELHKGTTYERGGFTVGEWSWDVGIAQIGAGNAGAAFDAERAIDYFQPHIVLFVGVASGLKDVKMGDVVAVTKVYGYEAGKVQGTSFFTRPDVGESSYSLLQQATAEGRKGDWVRGIRGRDQPSPSRPNVYVGPIAAGEKVVADRSSEIVAFLHSHYKDALAVEMEGYGFLQAAHSNEQVQTLVIRGISDLIDNKNEVDAVSFQDIAARHASAFAFELLAKLNIPSSITELNMRQHQQLHDALLDAFPSRSTLRQLVYFGLDENLDTIASSSNLADTVFELITWTRAHGRVEELIRAAYQANPANVRLHAFVSQIGLAGLTDS